jgi:hypothetical protein
MGEIRTINEDYQKIANELIATRPELEDLRNSDVTIICLASDQEKKSNGKLIFGQTEKIADKYKWGIPCDFTITIFDPNVAYWTADQMKILMLHELLHVGVDGDRLYIRPHDLEDFKSIIAEYGVDWAEV